MKDKYEVHYQLLGIRPGDSWQRLRKAYKSQMRRWHPDRFGQDDPARRQAEERTKEINRFYQELAEFYQLNGKLPLDSAPRPTVVPDHSTRAETVPITPPANHADWNPQTPPSDFRGKNQRPGLILVLIIGLVASYTYWDPEIFKSQDETMTAPVDGNAAAGGEHGKQAGVTGTDEGQFIEVGSTLGEVYSIQGIPNLVQGDVWHYGEARVFFHNGRVTKWIDTDNPRLKVRAADTQKKVAQIVISTFGLGSTHDEVRAVQGSPLRESGNVWDYGLSRVYFDNTGRVTGWQESPLNPLRVKH